MSGAASKGPTRGEGRVELPGFLAWMQDETFVWVAVGELLIALGVAPETVRRVGALRSWVPELRALAQEADARRGALAVAGVRAHGEAAINTVAPVAIDVAREVLERLRILRIRTELLGIDADAARRGIDDIERWYRSGTWRSDPVGGLDDAGEVLASSVDAMLTPPVPARAGEVRRIVGVLRAMPRSTLRRITKVTSAPALAALVSAGLRAVRGSGGILGPDNDGPTVDPAVAEQQRRDEVEAQRAAAANARRAAWRFLDRAGQVLCALALLGVLARTLVLVRIGQMPEAAISWALDWSPWPSVPLLVLAAAIVRARRAALGGRSAAGASHGLVLPALEALAVGAMAVIGVLVGADALGHLWWGIRGASPADVDRWAAARTIACAVVLLIDVALVLVGGVIGRHRAASDPPSVNAGARG